MYTMPPPTPKNPDKKAPIEPNKKSMIKSVYVNTAYFRLRQI
jgi:hypothetical protein